MAGCQPSASSTPHDPGAHAFHLLENLNMHQFHFFDKAVLLSLTSLILLAGCSQSPALVDIDIAKDALASTMESWKQGKSPQDLLKEAPSIVVQETEWTEGTKLLDYELVEDDKPAGQNLIAKVKLKLSRDDGKVIEKTATYVVGTSPKICVYRNLMK
jgi:hypothetical protein